MSGKPAARLTDMHECPEGPHVGGPVNTVGSSVTLIGRIQAARVTDTAVCNGPPDVVAQGSRTVIIGGQRAARMDDMTSHGGKIVQGLNSVIIGEDGGVPLPPIPLPLKRGSLAFIPQTLNAMVDAVPLGPDVLMFFGDVAAQNIRDYDVTRSNTVGLRVMQDSAEALLDRITGQPPGSAPAKRLIGQVEVRAGKAALTKLAPKLDGLVREFRPARMKEIGTKVGRDFVRSLQAGVHEKIEDAMVAKDDLLRLAKLNQKGGLLGNVDIDKVFDKSVAKAGRVVEDLLHHFDATDIRKATKLSGDLYQSMHLWPQVLGKQFANYDPRKAVTMLGKIATHRAFDKHWKEACTAMRQAGRTQITVREAVEVMNEAIRKMEGLSDSSMAFSIDMLAREVYDLIGAKPDDMIHLPKSGQKRSPRPRTKKKRR